MVFGGIAVDEIEFDGIKRKKPVYLPSGDYMWNFMNDLKDRFHIFVAASSKVGGNAAYNSLIKNMKEEEITHPSDVPERSGGGGPDCQASDANFEAVPEFAARGCKAQRREGATNSTTPEPSLPFKCHLLP